MSDMIEHHGILGQKWGKRNGPPYPLGASEHSGSEKKAGWRKSIDKPDSSNHTKGTLGGETDYDQKKHGLTDKQKKAIKIGAAAVATALAAYGTYKLVKSGKLDKQVAIGRDYVNNLMGKKNGGFEFAQQKVSDLLGEKSVQKAAGQTVGGIKKLAKAESLAETLKKVNPNRGNRLYDNNCTYCSITTFLRSIGYDVTAKDTGGQPQNLGGVIERCFKGAKVLDGSAVKFGRSTKDAAEMLVGRFGNNASGVCDVQFKGGGGHAFNWSIKDGVVKFFDGQDIESQINKSNLIDVFWSRINQNGGLTIARLDNAEVIEDAVKKVVQ